MGTTIDVERAVSERYGQAAKDCEPALCCPIQYDPEYLAVIPDEILELDYGSGDPSTFVRKGDVVLDLGSSGGKICYIAAQMVGPGGRVIGVDANDEILALSRKYSQEIGECIGYHNVEFRMGSIQDLGLDLSLVDSYLANSPVTSPAEMLRFNQFTDKVKADRPLVSDESVDLVLSNCVLNLVRSEDTERLFNEIFRVVRIGGRAAISDIMSDEDGTRCC